MTEAPPVPETQDMRQYYVLGAIVLIAVVVAGYLLRPKSPQTTTTPISQTNTPVVPTPTPGPITNLACDTQYYNPVIGFAKYYLSVEGGDVSSASKVDCAFAVVANNKQVAEENVSSPLTDKPQRGGSTFRCTTKGLELKPGIPTTVTVQLKDNLNASASCSSTFLLPAP